MTSSYHHEDMSVYQEMISSHFKLKLEELLGSGAFSSVYKARNTENNELVAVKCIKQIISTTNDCAEAAKEIAVLNALKHPNVLSLKFYDINKNFTYIGTEFAHCQTLQKYHQEISAPLSENVVKYVMIQLSSAVCYIHELGILHGDIKPENILCFSMTENGPSIKLGDFGLCRIIMKGTGLIKFSGGSLFYMAPENHLRQPVDTRCDLWSTGALMYKLIYNKIIYYFPENQKVRFLECIKARTPISFSDSGNYSRECINLLSRLLQFDMNDRITGKDICAHPFLKIEPQKDDPKRFLNSGESLLNQSINSYDKGDFGESLAQVYQGVTELKIYHNLINDEGRQRELKDTLNDYEDFIVKVQHSFIQYCTENACSKNCTDDQFRKHLFSTPKLLQAFDNGCNAEMYMKSGDKKRALSMFHESVHVLLLLLKTEPKSNRKIILGKKIRQWIEYINVLQVQLESPLDRSIT